MSQNILELLAEKKYSAVKQQIAQMEEVDLAELFEELENENDPDMLNKLFRLLPKETAAEVFSYMEPEIQEKIVTSLTDAELQNILDDLFMDDYVDLVEEMPANVVKRVMQNTTPANRKLINQYLKYPEDSAGSLMTNEYVYFRSGLTVQNAFGIIREHGVDKETIYTCYVTSARKELLGGSDGTGNAAGRSRYRYRHPDGCQPHPRSHPRRSGRDRQDVQPVRYACHAGRG